MLESQKAKIHERHRLREKGLGEEQIRREMEARMPPFRPAFVNGRRREAPDQAEGLVPVLALPGSRFARA